MIFRVWRLPGACIKTLQQNLTTYKFFFSMNLAQANKSYVNVTVSLFSYKTFLKKVFTTNIIECNVL